MNDPSFQMFTDLNLLALFADELPADLPDEFIFRVGLDDEVQGQAFTIGFRMNQLSDRLHKRNYSVTKWFDEGYRANCLHAIKRPAFAALPPPGS